MAALEWLAAELGRPIAEPRAHHAIAALRAALLAEREVAVFGAGGAGEAVARYLERHGVEVAFFLDNHKRGQLLGRPIHAPGSRALAGLPVVIASTWFFEIARQLASDPRLAGARAIYPLPNPDMLENPLFADMVGRPFLDVLEAREAEFRQVAALWADAASRRRFVQLLAYRAEFLCPESIRAEQLPMPPADFAAVPVPAIPAGGDAALEGALRHCFAHPYYGLAGAVWPRPGDRVVDGGAWIGDTALWFLAQTAPDGRVAAFEPSPATRAVLARNLSACGVAGGVAVEGCGLGAAPGTLHLNEIPESSQSNYLGGSGGMEVPVTTLDRWFESSDFDRVDFIKLDLEGADLDALRGGAELVRRLRPDLAISLYHSPHHLVDIPLFIRALDAGYRLHLSHRHVGVTETVCLATRRGAP